MLPPLLEWRGGLEAGRGAGLQEQLVGQTGEGWGSVGLEEQPQRSIEQKELAVARAFLYSKPKYQLGSLIYGSSEVEGRPSSPYNLARVR